MKEYGGGSYLLQPRCFSDCYEFLIMLIFCLCFFPNADFTHVLMTVS